MTDFHEVSEPARRFAESILRIFPEWADAMECPGQGDVLGDCSFCVVPPEHPTHRLYVVTRRGTAAEIRYHDGVSPGPAEFHFSRLAENPEEVAEDIGEFVRDIINGQIVMVRERLPRWVRWLRRKDCDSLLSFQSVEESGRSSPPKVVAVYSWRAVP